MAQVYKVTNTIIGETWFYTCVYFDIKNVWNSI